MIEYMGKEYKTRAELAREYGQNPETVKKRLQKGWTLQRALTAPVEERNVGKSKPVVCNGKTYSSMNDFAKAIGISPRCLRYRLGVGATFEEAASMEYNAGRPLTKAQKNPKVRTRDGLREITATRWAGPDLAEFHAAMNLAIGTVAPWDR